MYLNGEDMDNIAEELELNKNMRCIWIIPMRLFPNYYNPLNKNMRCIWIQWFRNAEKKLKKLNKNMRCIWM